MLLLNVLILEDQNKVLNIQIILKNTKIHYVFVLYQEWKKMLQTTIECHVFIASNYRKEWLLI